MSKPFKIPKHLRTLNPDVPAVVRVAERPRAPGATADKRGEFGYWWRTLIVKDGDYFPAAWSPAEGVKFGKWEFDWAFERLLVAVEVDGGQHQAGGGRHAQDGDRWKLCEAAAQGWVVLRFSPEMLTADPDRCCSLVHRALVFALERANGNVGPEW